MTRIEQSELDVLLSSHAKIWDENLDSEAARGETLALFEYNLSGLDFSNRELRSCHLINCDLRNCNFTNSNLSHSELIGSDLRMAVMTNIADEGTDFTDCLRA